MEEINCCQCKENIVNKPIKLHLIRCDNAEPYDKYFDYCSIECINKKIKETEEDLILKLNGYHILDFNKIDDNLYELNVSFENGK